MKILVITDLYPIREDERFTPKTILNFVESWKELGHEVNIIKPNFLFNSFLRKKPYYKDGFYGSVENLNFFFPFLGDIKNKIKTDLNADIIIAHMPSGIIFANKLKKPFVAGVHSSDIEVLTNPIYSIYFRQALEDGYKNAIKIACRSEVLKQKFLKLYPQFKDKTFVAFSGIKENLILRREWQPKENIKILTCANFIKRKNIDKVIFACDKIANTELTIIGDGVESKNLKKLSKKPKFLGFLPNQQVIEKMRSADIFILPSQNETFGMVYLEAMASGCITVGLKGEGIDGIIKDKENGFLTNLDNIKEMLEEIIFSANPNKILEKSYETILEYTEINAAKNYLSNIFSSEKKI